VQERLRAGYRDLRYVMKAEKALEERCSGTWDEILAEEREQTWYPEGRSDEDKEKEQDVLRMVDQLNEKWALEDKEGVKSEEAVTDENGKHAISNRRIVYESEIQWWAKTFEVNEADIYKESEEENWIIVKS
jgi:hypothetical protein